MKFLYLATILLVGLKKELSGYMEEDLDVLNGVFQLRLKYYKESPIIENNRKTQIFFYMSVKIGEYSNSMTTDKKHLGKLNALIFNDAKDEFPINTRLPETKTDVELSIEVLKIDGQFDNRNNIMRKYHVAIIEHSTLTEDWIKKKVIIQTKDGKYKALLVYEYRIKCPNDVFKGPFCTQNIPKTTMRLLRKKRDASEEKKRKKIATYKRFFAKRMFMRSPRAFKPGTFAKFKFHHTINTTTVRQIEFRFQMHVIDSVSFIFNVEMISLKPNAFYIWWRDENGTEHTPLHHRLTRLGNFRRCSRKCFEFTIHLLKEHDGAFFTCNAYIIRRTKSYEPHIFIYNINKTLHIKEK